MKYSAVSTSFVSRSGSITHVPGEGIPTGTVGITSVVSKFSAEVLEGTEDTELRSEGRRRQIGMKKVKAQYELGTDKKISQDYVANLAAEVARLYLHPQGFRKLPIGWKTLSYSKCYQMIVNIENCEWRSIGNRGGSTERGI